MFPIRSVLGENLESGPSLQNDNAYHIMSVESCRSLNALILVFFLRSWRLWTDVCVGVTIILSCSQRRVLKIAGL